MPQSPPPSSSNPAGRAADFDNLGSPAARAIHGHSAGADVVVLGRAADGSGGPAAVLTEVCAPARYVTADGAGPGGDGVAGDLRLLADLAARGGGPLVLADARLAIELPAALDLLDVPADSTAALLADPRNIEAPRQVWSGLDRATLARVGPDGLIESSSAAGHPVSAPNRVVVGLLRIAAADRPRAAELWRRAAEAVGSAPVSSFDLALLALVRGALRVTGSAIGYFDWSRDGCGAAGIGRSPWRQRLRSASRLGDGAYSAAVVRPLSRLGTRVALAIDLTPNPITVISIVIGVIAALLIITGQPAAWIVAAVLVQAALVIDCMDGEVARFTRRFSTFGAWLDGIGDRLKEYLIFAAVAVVAARDGLAIGWPLAVLAMVLITVRHLEDYAYSDRAAADRVSRVVARSLAEAGDGGDSSRTTLPAEASAQQKLIFWAKKIVHVPVAERTLIISLGLLTLQPLVVLIASIVVSGIALVWTFGGRFLRALRTPRPHGGTELDRQLDLGPIGSRLARPLIARAAAATPGRLDWLALPLIFVVEAAVIMVAGAVTLWPDHGWLVFVAVAAIAYRRYELIYGIRLFPPGGRRPVLGADGRVLFTLLVWLVATLTSPVVLVVGLLALAAEAIVEGVLGTPVRRAVDRPNVSD